MFQPFEYTGCFVDKEQLRTAVAPLRTRSLACERECPHVTFVYRPARINRALFGAPITVTVVGYGSDGTNEGVLVRLEAEDPTLRQQIAAIEVPHITLSLSREGKAVDTRYLRFDPVEPIELQGVYGAYRSNGTVETGATRK